MLLHYRSCWIVFIHIVRGRPSGLLQFCKGKAVKKALSSVLSDIYTMWPNTTREKRCNWTIAESWLKLSLTNDHTVVHCTRCKVINYRSHIISPTLIRHCTWSIKLCILVKHWDLFSALSTPCGIWEPDPFPGLVSSGLFFFTYLSSLLAWLFSSVAPVKRLAGKICLQNELQCVKWDIKLNSTLALSIWYHFFWFKSDICEWNYSGYDIMLVCGFRAVKLILLWCWTSWDVMVCWRELESVARDFRAALYFKSSASAMNCWLQESFHEASWMAKKHAQRWSVVLQMLLHHTKSCLYGTHFFYKFGSLVEQSVMN